MLILILLILLLILIYFTYYGEITQEDVIYAQELASEYANEARKIYELFKNQ